MHHIRSAFLTLAFTASLLLWASIVVTPATADLVKFNFTGTVTGLNGSAVTSYSISSDPNSPNSVLTGSYTFDSSPVAEPPWAFSLALTNLTLNLGTFNSNGIPAGIVIPCNCIFVGNDVLSAGENYFMRSLVLEISNPGTFLINLGDGSGGFIESFNITPTTPPDLSSFASNSFNLLVPDGQGGSAVAVGAIISLNLNPVPLPPAVILFGAGLVALIGLGARSRQQKGNNLG